MSAPGGCEAAVLPTQPSILTYVTAVTCVTSVTFRT
jgi:hypothetical protein